LFWIGAQTRYRAAWSFPRFAAPCAGPTYRRTIIEFVERLAM
jgi:hypothetical protein